MRLKISKRRDGVRLADSYEYPLMAEWSTTDIIAVTTLYQCVEAAYEQPQGVDRHALLQAYQDFQQVVPQKFEEKQLDQAFQTVFGYSIYRTVKQARATDGMVKMKG